jgi:hypothetical protein
LNKFELFCVAMTISLGATVPASATTVSGTYGDVVIQSNGFLVTSDTTGTGYGGLYFQYSTPILLNSITQLSADYQMTMGTFGGGAPRFTLFDSGGNSAYIYFGTPLGGQGFADPNLGAPEIMPLQLTFVFMSTASTGKTPQIPQRRFSSS